MHPEPLGDIPTDSLFNLSGQQLGVPLHRLISVILQQNHRFSPDFITAILLAQTENRDHRDPVFHRHTGNGCRGVSFTAEKFRGDGPRGRNMLVQQDTNDMFGL